MKSLAVCLPFLVATFAACAAPVPIFDGKTLDGWEGDAKWWRVQDGALTGGSMTEKVPRNFFLATTKTYHNFDLRLQIKLTGVPNTGMLNSGVQIRSLRVPNNTEMSGYQVDYGVGWYGKLYDESRRNKVISESANLKAAAAAIREGDWNEYRVRAEGPRIQSWINGVPALDYTEADPNIAQDGHIAVQIHSGGMALVQVKDVLIEELPPTPNAPTWEKVGKPGEKKKGAEAKPMKEGNAPDAGARSPEEERAAFKLPEGFEAELVAAEDPANGIGKFVPIAFDQRGALWTTTALEYPVDGNENPAAADALYASKAKDKVLIYDRDPKSPTGYASKPRVFAEGLAIPLGVLPYKNGCYVQHGHDIAFLEDTDGDGKSDKRTVTLTGFGVQDSHLFPHQFLRAPGGWIWMAQGAFNYSKVRKPDEPAEKAVQFDQTRMAKFRPDGSQFTITSNGPCNIWGLVLNGEGEAFIQEANDFGYPVMPFHEYANYPGCSDRQWKSYAPEFPGTAPDFRMGGTGLSGLALTDKNGPFPEPWRDVMLVANPITNRIQGIKMHRDGPYWKLDKPVDFLVSADPWFRPVAITIGPDGCLYIVDWYNKIISHNEVPRNHPDRDKTRGRIWRVKAKAKAFDVPDFTKLSGDELIAKLGGDSLTQSHLAWQTLADRNEEKSFDRLLQIASKGSSPAVQIQALWALDEVTRNGDRALWNALWDKEAAPRVELLFARLSVHPDRNVRREFLRVLGNIVSHDNNSAGRLVDPLQFFYSICKRSDVDPEVRAEMIRSLARYAREMEGRVESVFNSLLTFAGGPLIEPTAPSTRAGKAIKVGKAYDRDFERYLVRMTLERFVAEDGVETRRAGQEWKFSGNFAADLDSENGRNLPIEARLLASLALEPKASAARVARLLPQLERAPGQEEVLRLAQFPEEPGVGGALTAMLGNSKTSAPVLNALLELRTKIDTAKLAPFITGATTKLLASKDTAEVEMGVKLAGAFQFGAAEPALLGVIESGTSDFPGQDIETKEVTVYLKLTPVALQALGRLREMGSGQLDLFEKLSTRGLKTEVREEAIAALVASKSPEAPQRVLAMYPRWSPTQRRAALEKLSTTKPGAKAIVDAVSAGALAKDQLDAAVLDRLQAVLGENDPALAKLLGEMSAFFRPVLTLDGSENAWTETGMSLDGPLTVETWVRLDPDKRKIGNADGILGAPGQLDINFYDAKFRVYCFAPHGDVVIAKKPVTPGMWTHVTATRDAAGIWKVYIDGELDGTATKPVPAKLENLRLAWTAANGGTRGAFAEYRIWNRERTAGEIRATFDRSLASGGHRVVGAPTAQSSGTHGAVPSSAASLVFPASGGDWGKLQPGAKVTKTSDLPPVLTADQAALLDGKFAKYTALASQPGDIERGKQAALICTACHLIGQTGGNIGPNLSGAGAMGVEAVLRNILTPNAAMESAYRIYRVEQRDGSVLDTFFVSEDNDAVVIRLPGAADQRLPKQNIVRTQFLRRSLMPEGLLDAMTDEQVRDLFAYLKSLK